MSPLKSSNPIMSVKTAYLSVDSTINPMAIPDTGAVIDTPASIKASVDPQVDAIEVDQFELIVSESTCTVYGNFSFVGITGIRALSANAPCPISRLFGLPTRPVSPTVNGAIV